jgi:hypothetical protein
VSPISKSCRVFACILGGALLGMFLRKTLPEYQLGADTKDVLRLGTGLITLVAALVLGLLIVSAKSAYDTQNTEIKEITANIILVDLILARYGPDTRTARDLLRRIAVILADRLWREKGSDFERTIHFESIGAADEFYDKLQELSPNNDAQGSLKARAIQITTDSVKTRLRLFAQSDNPIPMPFLVVLVFWLTMIFASFGLFAEPNVIVFCSLFIFVLSAASAIYLILELGRPFVGLMQISSGPLRNALAPLAPNFADHLRNGP